MDQLKQIAKHDDELDPGLIKQKCASSRISGALNTSQRPLARHIFQQTDHLASKCDVHFKAHRTTLCT